MAKDKRILVVDDEEILLHVLEDSIKLYCENFQVVSVTDGDAALKQLEQEPFDLILTDFWMPGMSGLDLARAARHISAETRIVLMTGLPDPELVQDNLSALRLEGFILKPFSLADLWDILQDSL